MANEYYSLNKLQEAEVYLKKFEDHLKNENDHSDFITHYIIKGNIENKRKNFEKALEYFETSEYLAKKYKIYSISLKDIYAGKATAYQGLQDYKNQAFFATKAKKITDSISIIEKKILNSPLLTDETDLPEEKNFLEKYDSLIYIIIFILFIIAAFFTYRHYSRKKTNLNNDDIDDGLTYENDESEMIENSESFDKQTIDQNNNIEVQSLEELITLARNNDKYFHLKFSKLFPKFNPQLLQINSQLTQSDLEYCALIKLNLSTKEIAQYKNVTVNSVVSKKYRIRKKLSISTNENIYTWMFDIG
ncbi:MULTISPECIES: helix-turn-helix transcriptional regulator [unclassified Chryseobacterium]|uniref:helix-turn-helix transcriptional regulator n=1 Tax=unclassified Chryseobacterium TaxID=2593645 RepID=UPI00100ADD43|nr:MULTISPECIES: hypothetical protein [unclassified Chryseobacterium]RXM50621.1 hypothetical protein BOQ64_17925 [Chryseobacterium sp. CH25]RXM63254.1 hypothetical protein BOQ60_18120 [Chryseobacterium sp. CH1]